MLLYSGNWSRNSISLDSLYLALLPHLVNRGAGLPNRMPVWRDCLRVFFDAPTTDAASCSESIGSWSSFFMVLPSKSKLLGVACSSFSLGTGDKLALRHVSIVSANTIEALLLCIIWNQTRHTT